jgi:hypothetical protein
LRDFGLSWGESSSDSPQKRVRAKTDFACPFKPLWRSGPFRENISIYENQKSCV